MQDRYNYLTAMSARTNYDYNLPQESTNMRESARKSVLALCFALIAATTWAASPAVTARLSTAGTVWTNQVALPSGSTIRPGDRIVTGPSASASISSPETGRMEVRRDSEVTFRRDGLLLHRGVVSTQRASIATANYRVEVPAGSGANPLIVVAKRDGQVLVAAHRGNALVTAPGLAPVLIPAGNFAVSAASAPGGDQNSQPGARGATANDEEEKKKKKRAGAAPAGSGGKAASSGWTIGSLSHQASVALVSALGAAAVGGTAAGFALTGSSPSPTQ